MHKENTFPPQLYMDNYKETLTNKCDG